VKNGGHDEIKKLVLLVYVMGAQALCYCFNFYML